MTCQSIICHGMLWHGILLCCHVVMVYCCVVTWLLCYAVDNRTWFKSGGQAWVGGGVVF